MPGREPGLFDQQDDDEIQRRLERVSGLLAEAIEGLESVPAKPGSWLARARGALGK
jgi:hypothetical protein